LRLVSRQPVVVGAAAGALGRAGLKVLVTGAAGQLGTDVVAEFGRRGTHDVVAAGHGKLDVGDRDAVHQAIGALAPDLVVHAGAWTAVDACESDPDRAWRTN